MSALSEEVKQFLEGALKLPADRMNALQDQLIEYGVQDMADLEWIDPEKDLLGSLHLIACRKLAFKLMQHFSNTVSDAGQDCSTPAKETHMTQQQILVPQTLKTPQQTLIPESPTTPQQTLTPQTAKIQQQTLVRQTPQALQQTSVDFDGSPAIGQTVTPSTSGHRPSYQYWAESFEIPWGQFPDGVLTACRNKRRPEKSDVLQMVRILCGDIAKQSQSPGRANLDIIARKVVATYPDSFMDSLSRGQDKGHITLSNRLRDRFEHLKREKPGKSTYRRKLLEVEDTTNGSVSKKRKAASALQLYSYGCVRWQPDIPNGESADTQEEKRVRLTEEYQMEQHDYQKIDQLMLETYPTQRFCINKGTHLKTVRANWPFLFHPQHLLKHFEHLMNFDLMATLDNEMARRSDIMLHYLQAQPSITSTVYKLSVLAKVLANSDPTSYGILTVLPLVFGETKREIFKQVEETTTAAEIEEQDHPTHPHVVFTGPHPYAENCYAVVGGCILAQNVSLRMALGLAFAAFYVFNIPYPSAVAHTLEFIQRVLAGINPTRGSKVERTDKKRRISTSSKVRKLCDNLYAFDKDWTI